jgi:hypothetical protein
MGRPQLKKSQSIVYYLKKSFGNFGLFNAESKKYTITDHSLTSLQHPQHSPCSLTLPLQIAAPSLHLIENLPVKPDF